MACVFVFVLLDDPMPVYTQMTKGNVYFLAQHFGVTSLGKTTLTPPLGLKPLYVAKLNARGPFQWALNLGTRAKAEHMGNDLTIDAQDNLITLSVFKGTHTIAGQVMTSTAPGNVGNGLILKLNPNGQLIWKQVLSPAGWVFL